MGDSYLYPANSIRARNFGYRVYGTVFSPSNSAIGLAAITSPIDLHDAWKSHSSSSWEDFRKGVRRRHGSERLIDKKAIDLVKIGGNAATSYVKAKRDNLKDYHTKFKGVMLEKYGISRAVQLDCACEDASWAKIRDESNQMAVVCGHGYAMLHAIKGALEGELDPNLVGECSANKRIRGDTVLQPFKIWDYPEDWIDMLDRMYVYGDTHFTVDVDFLTGKQGYSHLWDETFEKAVEKGIATLEPVKNNDHPPGINRWVQAVGRDFLQDQLGFHCTGLALETVDGQGHFGGRYWAPVWNYETGVDGKKLQARVIAPLTEMDMVNVVLCYPANGHVPSELSNGKKSLDWRTRSQVIKKGFEASELRQGMLESLLNNS